MMSREALDDAKDRRNPLRVMAYCVNPLSGSLPADPVRVLVGARSHRCTHRSQETGPTRRASSLLRASLSQRRPSGPRPPTQPLSSTIAGCMATTHSAIRSPTNAASSESPGGRPTISACDGSASKFTTRLKGIMEHSHGIQLVGYCVQGLPDIKLRESTVSPYAKAEQPSNLTQLVSLRRLKGF